MTSSKQEEEKKYDAAIQACAMNAKRLYEDVRCLLDYDRFEAAYHLAILAQEECAKAFILRLINESILPWTKEVARAMRTHECKHLVGIIMVRLSPPSYEEAQARNKCMFDGTPARPAELPRVVADAINVLRHEKIGRWVSKHWWWVEDPEWDPQAMKVAEGKIERMKQRAVYTDVSENGACQVPKVTKREAEVQYQRAEQMLEITDGPIMSFQEDWAVQGAMKAVFANLFPKDPEQSADQGEAGTAQGGTLQSG